MYASRIEEKKGTIPLIVRGGVYMAASFWDDLRRNCSPGTVISTDQIHNQVVAFWETRKEGQNSHDQRNVVQNFDYDPVTKIFKSLANGRETSLGDTEHALVSRLLEAKGETVGYAELNVFSGYFRASDKLLALRRRLGDFPGKNGVALDRGIFISDGGGCRLPVKTTEPVNRLNQIMDDFWENSVGLDSNLNWLDRMGAWLDCLRLSCEDESLVSQIGFINRYGFGYFPIDRILVAEFLAGVLILPPAQAETFRDLISSQGESVEIDERRIQHLRETLGDERSGENWRFVQNSKNNGYFLQPINA